MNQPKNPAKYLIFSLVLIAVDQLSKLLVHKYMEPGFSGQIALIGSWLKLHYVLNPGMAFGMQLGHEYGKLFLTLFRLVAMFAIGWYLVHLARSGAAKGLLWALAMILAGAVGNVIDSTFYGVLLDNAPYGAPTPWFHGQVIDMIFVDFWEGFVPDWVPVWGGQYYSTPIFNIADSCIFIGVCSILIFQGHFHPVQPAPADDEMDKDTSISPEASYIDVKEEGIATSIPASSQSDIDDVNKESQELHTDIKETPAPHVDETLSTSSALFQEEPKTEAEEVNEPSSLELKADIDQAEVIKNTLSSDVRHTNIEETPKADAGLKNAPPDSADQEELPLKQDEKE